MDEEKIPTCSNSALHTYKNLLKYVHNRFFRRPTNIKSEQIFFESKARQDNKMINN